MYGVSPSKGVQLDGGEESVYLTGVNVIHIFFQLYISHEVYILIRRWKECSMKTAKKLSMAVSIFSSKSILASIHYLFGS